MAQQKDPVLKRLLQWMSQERRPSLKKVKNDSAKLCVAIGMYLNREFCGSRLRSVAGVLNNQE
ncbi:unnamed protein product [Clavelina lepadiformis]|uniref:Uncharacterized protein n=1 Tax=Clavelina lepadiformis TaxID=159417 RepID=A0ABP0FMD9_CLALP